MLGSIMRRLTKGKFTLLREQKGVTLIETIIALGLLGIIGVGFLAAVATGNLATDTVDEQVTAQSLARAQLEDIKNAAYLDSGDYPTTVTPPPGYAVSIEALPLGRENTIQGVTVTVYRDGKVVLAVEDFKVKR